jgi:Flp pilus assembly protein TadD
VSFERAVAAKPNYAEALNNRGNALVELGRSQDALASYEQALVHRPAFADALTNRANTCVSLATTVKLC